MKNLVVDQGNTRTKIAIFHSDTLVELVTIENDLAEETTLQLCEKHTPRKAILSSVTHENAIPELIKMKVPYFVELNENTPLPFINDYRSKSTLGKDRLAGIAGAFALKPYQNCLVIDAGTAITYDIINTKGIYVGGSIAPGLNMRFKALHNFTSKLPLVNANPQLPVTGTDTVTSINSGVFHGMVNEIEGFISHYEKYYPDLFVFLTGGDAVIFEKNIKNSIFVALNLVISGLNSLLEKNNAE